MFALSTQVFVKPLLQAPDRHDLALHASNCCPVTTTRRLHELVPLLAFIGCSVEEIGAERTILSAPLLPNAMNQNGTQQAAVFYLLADYTLGVGMFGVLPGTYVTGIHDRCHALPVQYWLKRGHVEHLAPGTGPLRAETRISVVDAERMRRQLIERGRCEYEGTVTITQGGDVVAEARHTMGIYADVPRSAGVRANLFQVQNLKTSALMIAGLREDALSQHVAGEQGRAIASRMAIATPQLPHLVRARGLHLGQVLDGGDGNAFAQVLVIGIGLDPKPLQHARAGQRWFGVDLRDMLRERALRFATCADSATEGGAHLVTVAGDIRLDNWDANLRQAGFDTRAPTLVVAEGMSMYFSATEFGVFLGKLRALNVSPQTRLWLDHVSSAAFALEHLEVRAFLASMSRLGEPFVLGFDDASTIAPDAWLAETTSSAAAVLHMDDPVCAEYRFTVLRPADEHAPVDIP